MGDEINVGDISGQGIAVGDHASTNVTINYTLPDYRPDAVHNLPPPNPNFTGSSRQRPLCGCNR